jgi:hypothetical protein
MSDAETALHPDVQHELEQLTYEVQGKTDLEKLRAVQDCAAASHAHRTPELERDLIEIAQQCETKLPQDAIKRIVIAGFERGIISQEWQNKPPPRRPNGVSDDPPPTPQSTIDALLYGLRRGLSCLEDSAEVDRLTRCDERAIRTIAAELVTRKTKDKPWLPAWSEEDISKLIDVWRVTK